LPSITGRGDLATDGLSLVAHVQACGQAKGAGFALRCVGERLHDLVAPRFVTTVFTATVLMVIVAASA
jgi:hypothetical protein